MLRGEKVEEGTVSDIFNRPEHPYTKALLSAVPRLGSMEGLTNPAKFPNVDASRAEGDEVVLVDESAESLEIAGTVQQSDVPLLEINGLTTRFDMGGGFLSQPIGPGACCRERFVRSQTGRDAGASRREWLW